MDARLTKDEIFSLLQRQADSLRQLGVARLGLFGSFVRRQQTPESDIDLLVDFEEGQKTYDNFIRLSFFLEELFGRPVELLTNESLSPYIGPHVRREVEYVTFNN